MLVPTGRILGLGINNVNFKRQDWIAIGRSMINLPSRTLQRVTSKLWTVKSIVPKAVVKLQSLRKDWILQ